MPIKAEMRRFYPIDWPQQGNGQLALTQKPILEREPPIRTNNFRGFVVRMPSR